MRIELESDAESRWTVTVTVNGDRIGSGEGLEGRQAVELVRATVEADRVARLLERHA